MLNVFQRVKEKRRDMAKYTVAVAGATGYAGGEALRILAAHPNFEVTCVAGHSSVGDKLGKHMPHIPQLADLVVEDTTPEVLNGHDVIILALPHGASGALASQLDPNAVVVDLGADHRLEEKSAWDAFYGGDFYQHWTYGMPELITGVAADGSYSRQREALPGTKRIAGPGCNVTATTLALQPGIAQGLVESKDIVADLVVGYSGAGKNLKRTNLLAAEAFCCGGGRLHPRLHADSRADGARHSRHRFRQTHRQSAWHDGCRDPPGLAGRIRRPGFHGGAA